ncbi:methyltransferase domain-containing protein [Streptomyces sp. NPDC049915]|uniref:class I SAM-dependent methyltransferase n=1 Tax=Streptomyces sp. NPDC049915 TaxID=3155510 RepID=UPI00343684FF
MPAWAGDETYAGVLRAGRGPLFLQRPDGWLLPLEVERWCADADAVDLDVLDRCEGTVLDVGCGPGRLVAALAARGRQVLGLDVSEAAVAHTRRRLDPLLSGKAAKPPSGLSGKAAEPSPGAASAAPHIRPRRSRRGDSFAPPKGEPQVLPLGKAFAPRSGGGWESSHRRAAALPGSVFAPLPDEGHWGTALLLDGNIGIGGDPSALLGRLARVLVPRGLVLVETAPVDVDERATVRLTGAGGAAGSPFPWARLGTPALVRHARHAGWRTVAQWTAGGRCFVALRNRHTNSTAEPPKRAALISSQRVRKPSVDSPAPRS